MGASSGPALLENDQHLRTELRAPGLVIGTDQAVGEQAVAISAAVTLQQYRLVLLRSWSQE